MDRRYVLRWTSLTHRKRLSYRDARGKYLVVYHDFFIAASWHEDPEFLEKSEFSVSSATTTTSSSSTKSYFGVAGGLGFGFRCDGRNSSSSEKRSPPWEPFSESRAYSSAQS